MRYQGCNFHGRFLDLCFGGVLDLPGHACLFADPVLFVVLPGEANMNPHKMPVLRLVCLAVEHLPNEASFGVEC